MGLVWDSKFGGMTVSYWPPFISNTSIIDLGQASTIDVLTRSFTFSQSRLLDVTWFQRESRKRGLDLDHELLELLHRRQALVPFFRIHPRKVEPAVGGDGGLRGRARSIGRSYALQLHCAGNASKPQ